MSLYINTNTQSIFAQRALNRNTFGLQKNIEKLSTGFRINRAADDAAGLSISEKLTSQIRGIEKAEQNIGDGISMVQTAEGSLAVIQDNLQRIRELVVQAENGTNSLNEQNAIQREINARVSAIEDIGDNTEFNGIALLDGTAGAAGVVTLQTGADNGQTTTVDLSTVVIDIDTTGAAGEMSENAGFALSALKITDNNAAAVSDEAGSGSAVNPSTTPLLELDDMLNNVSRMRSELGAIQNSLESKAEYLNVARENAESSRSRIRDVDVAKESSNMVRNQILQQSAAAMLSQANQSPQLALSLLP